MESDMEYNRAEILYQKYLSGEIAPNELQELDVLLLDEKNEQDFRDFIRLNRSILELSDGREDVGKPDKNVIKITKGKISSGNINYLKYAAVLVIIIGLGYFLTLLNSTSENTFGTTTNAITLKVSEEITKNIEKGAGTQTVLTLETVILMQSGDTLKYIKQKEPLQLEYNEIKVPNSEKIVLQLSDQSFVTLNSGSILRYPTNFLSVGKREVQLIGEAYFQVNSDETRPFIVTAGDLNISVLGTEFNVTAYASDNFIKTVLVEGSVSVTKTSGPSDGSVTLKPNTLASYNVTEGSITTSKVNPGIYTSWMQGNLIFEREEFASIVKILERKFDVKIEIKDRLLAKEEFTARVSGDNIEEILDHFKLSYPFTYKKTGNQYVITHDDD